jgi:TRAP-type mannitol/chloroaromatic compound transport system permease small subunit
MSAQRLSGLITAFNRRVGFAVSWLTLIMVVTTCVIVALRYLFDTGWIWMQESVTWMHAAVFMLGAAYTLVEDEHVRVDIFYRDMSVQRKALVNAIGVVLFLMPFSVFLFTSSWEYVALSWQVKENSAEAGGLVYPLLPIMKSFIPLLAALLFLQGVALFIQSLLTLRTAAPTAGENP